MPLSVAAWAGTRPASSGSVQQRPDDRSAAQCHASSSAEPPEFPSDLFRWVRRQSVQRWRPFPCGRDQVRGFNHGVSIFALTSALLSVLAASVHASEPASTACPGMVRVPQAGFPPIAGWHVAPAPRDARFIGGDLVEGQIEKPPFAILEGLDMPRRSGAEPLWIFCSYQDTALQLVHQLPPGVRSCRMSGTFPDGKDVLMGRTVDPRVAAPLRLVNCRPRATGHRSGFSAPTT